MAAGARRSSPGVQRHKDTKKWAWYDGLDPNLYEYSGSHYLPEINFARTLVTAPRAWPAGVPSVSAQFNGLFLLIPYNNRRGDPPLEY